MGIVKEHDWVLETLFNPTFTNTDFKSIGINSSNTSIGPVDAYLKSPEIQSMPQFQTNGKFDSQKFTAQYRTALKSYNQLAMDTYEQDLDKDQSAIFAYNDIFVSPEKRQAGPQAVMYFQDNPTRQTFGVVELNTPGRQYKTIDEIAQQNQIWDSKTNSFTEETPEDSFFKNFFRPMAIAVWEYDADANGKATTDPSKVVYKQGDLKLHNGEPYYEFLNGKSGYGRQILSKMNILTKEDSWLNKIDFFDSDDAQKSVFGSVMLNAAKIVPLFIPYVGPAYMYTSLALAGTEALATLGKMFTNSNNASLNETTSFIRSLNTGVSEYGQQHAFSMENILNMVGETFQFIKSQRLLAEQAPSWFGNKLLKEKEASDKVKALAEAETTETLLKTQTQLAKSQQEIEKIMAVTLANNTDKYRRIVQAEIENYQKLGQAISRNYMAITFGTHTYEAAKAEGVDDVPATLLTLGAIAGQYALLNSHIGKWVFPESNLAAQQRKMVLQKFPEFVNENAIKELSQGAGKAVTKAQKLNWAEKIWNKGRDFASKVYDSPMQTTVQAAVTGGIASGVEMTSFAVLDDVIGQVYNTAQWFAGNSHRMHPWENMFERYATSFLGGAVAGVMSVPELKKAANQIHQITPEYAYKQVIQLVAEGKADELIKEVDKVKWNTSDLSFDKYKDPETGEELFTMGSQTDNQNQYIREGVKNEIKLIRNILDAHNALIGSDSLLNTEIRGPLKMAALYDSVVVKDYLSDYYDVLTKIVKTSKELSSIPDTQRRQYRDDYIEAEKEYNKLQKQYEQTKKEEDKKAAEQAKQRLDDLNALSTKKSELADLIDQKNQFLNGDLAPKYMQVALFEMSLGVNEPYLKANFIPWVEKKFNKNYEELTEEEKAKGRKDYKEFLDTQKRAYIESAFELFKPVNNIASNFLSKIKEKDVSKNLDFNNTQLLKHIYNTNIKQDVLKTFYTFVDESQSNLALESAKELNNTLTGTIYEKVINQLRGSRPKDFSSEEHEKIFSDVEQLISRLFIKYQQALGELQNLEIIKDSSPELYKEITDDITNYVTEIKTAKGTLENMLYSRMAADVLEKEISDLKIMTPTLYTKLNNIINLIQSSDSSINVNAVLTRKYDSNFRINKSEEALIPEQFMESVSKLNGLYTDITGVDTPFSKQIRNSKLEGIKDKVNKIPQTDLVKVLNSFGKRLTNGKFNFNDVYKAFSDLYINNITDLDQFLVGQADINNIEIAIDILKLFKSSIIAANDVVRDVDDVFGYNTTVNSMLENSDLAVLPESDTALLLDNVNAIQQQLEFFKNLTYIAGASKFKELLKYDTDAVFNIYNQLTSKFENIPDNWQGKQELLSDLRGIPNLPDLIQAGSRDLTTEQQNQVLKGLIDFEKAIYKFFQKNIDNVNNTEKLAKFLEMFNCYEDKANTIEAIGDVQDFKDDNGLLYYLASICALDPEIFYSNWAQAIINGVAPTIVQSYAVKSMLAFAENREIFDKFRQAYNINVAKHNEEKNGLLNASYETIHLTEAGPGAGKSTGILPQLIGFLRQIDGDKLKNIWFASTSTKKEPYKTTSADKIRDNSNVLEDECEVFTKQSLMERLCGKYEVTLTDQEELKLEKDDVNYNKDTGIATYTKNKLLENLDQNKLPKILIIDEYSDYSDLDLRIIDEFGKKYGVTTFLLGDSRQTGLIGEISTVDGKYALEVYRTQFVRTFLNNTSFRTNNTQQDYNFALDRAQFLTLKNYNDQVTLTYRYYIDKSGLYGRYINTEQGLSDELKNNFDLMIETFINDETVDKDETIGFVYDSEDGDLYKYAQTLPNEVLKRIEFHKHKPIKGVESKYYVIELNPNVYSDETFDHYKKVLYTAFSRAKQGNIIHMTEQLGEDISLESQRQNTNGLLRSPAEAIASYIKQLKVFLPTLYPNAIKVTAPTSQPTNKTTTQSTTTSTTTTTTTPEQDDTDEEPPTTEIDSDEETLSLFGVYNPVQPSKVESVINKNNNNETKIDVELGVRRLKLHNIGNEDVEGFIEKFEWEIYTAFNNYTGLIEDPILGYKESQKEDIRFDNYYGLKKLIQLYDGNKDLLLSSDPADKESNIEIKKEIVDILQELREAIWYTKDFDELESKIKMILKQNLSLNNDFDSFYIRPDIWESIYTRKSDDGDVASNDALAPAFRSKEEKLDGVHGSAANKDDISAKGLSLWAGAKVTDDSGTHDTVLLSIPYGKLPNPFTILDRFVKKGISWAIALDQSTRSIGNEYKRRVKMMQLLETQIKNQQLPGQTSLYYLLRAYTFNNDNFTPLIRPKSKNLFGNKIKWTPAQHLNTSAPYIISSPRGMEYVTTKDYIVNYSEGEDKTKVEYIPLTELQQNPLLTVSQNIYITTENVVDAYNNIKIKKGDPFVLVGTKYNNDAKFSEEELINHLNKQLNDSENKVDQKVAVVYVKSPQATIKEYLTQIRGIMRGIKPEDKKLFIGNDFTSFRIIQLLDTVKYEGSDKSYLQFIRDNMRDGNSLDSYIEKFRNYLTELESQGVTIQKLDEYDNEAFKIASRVMRESSGKTTRRGTEVTYGMIMNNIVLRLLLTGDLPQRKDPETNKTLRDKLFDKIEELWENKYSNNTIPYNTRFDNKEIKGQVGKSGEMKAVYKVMTDSDSNILINGINTNYTVGGKEFTVNIVRTPILVGDIFPIVASIGYAVNGRTIIDPTTDRVKLGGSGIRERLADGSYRTIDVIKEGLRLKLRDNDNRTDRDEDNIPPSAPPPPPDDVPPGPGPFEYEPGSEPPPPPPPPEPPISDTIIKFDIDDDQLFNVLNLGVDATFEEVTNACKENGFVWYDVEVNGNSKVKFAKNQITGFENYRILSCEKSEDDYDSIKVTFQNKTVPSNIKEVEITIKNKETGESEVKILNETGGLDDTVLINEETVIENARSLGIDEDDIASILLNTEIDTDLASELIDDYNGSEEFKKAFLKFRESLTQDDDIRQERNSCFKINLI